MSLKIPLLQRYVFREVFRVFAFVLGCITVLLMFVGVFQQATDRGLGPLQALQILPYVIPSLLPFTVPSALLLTVSVVYGRLAGDQELTAAKSAGIHPVSLMWPALALGAVLSVSSLILADQVIPWSVAKIEQHVISLVEDIFIDQLTTELQFSDSRMGLHVTVAGMEDRRLIQPIFQYARRDRVYTLQAEEAEIELDLKHEQALIHLRNGFIDFPGQERIHLVGRHTQPIRWQHDRGSEKPRNLTIETISKEMKRIEQEEEGAKVRQAMDAAFAFIVADFQRLIASQAAAGKNSESQLGRLYKLNTEVHMRYSLACSCFFFSLLGTPFAMRFGKTQYLTSFLLCFLPIVCGYYPLMLGLVAQCKEGHLAPEWAMWVANGAVTVLAISVLRKVIRY